MARVRRNLKPRSGTDETRTESAASGRADKELAAAAAVSKQGERRVALGTPVKPKTKKQKETAQLWRNPATRGAQLDALVAANVSAARKKTGCGEILHQEEHQRFAVCIPSPSLSWEFLIGVDGWPLGLILHLPGKRGIGKSGLVAEFCRWFDAAGGFGCINANESKWSPNWYKSIIWDQAVFNRLQINICDSVEDWQENLTRDIGGFKKLMTGTKENPGPGPTFPILFAVDSILGKLSRKTAEKIEAAGAAGLGYPVEQNQIARYMRTLPSWLDRWPFSLVLVNHLKIKRDDDNREVRQTPGGEIVGFQESFEVEVRRVGPKIATADFEGYVMELHGEKNSFGPDQRTIRVRTFWWHEDGRQRTVFDWHWSTMNLLWRILEGKSQGDVYLRSRLKKFDFDFQFESPTAVVGSLAWSESLGYNDKNKLSWSEMGQVLHENEEVKNRLREALGIFRQPRLDGDYNAILDKAAEKAP